MNQPSLLRVARVKLVQKPVLISLCVLAVALIIAAVYDNDHVDASVVATIASSEAAAGMTAASSATHPQYVVTTPGTVAMDKDADTATDNEPEPDPYEFHEFIVPPSYVGHMQPIAPETPTAADVEAQAEDEAEHAERELKDRDAAQLQSQAEAENARQSRTAQSRAADAIAHATQARPDGGECPVDSSVERPAAWTALPSEWRSKVGNLDVSVISYDKNPQQRFVLSGGVLVHEGDALANSARLSAVKASNRIIIQSSGCWVELSAADARH